jgi:hypothetical protein
MQFVHRFSSTLGLDLRFLTYQRPRWILVPVITLLLLCSGLLHAQNYALTSQTGLSVTTNGINATTVASGSQIALTASVTENGVPVHIGLIQFCDSATAQCTGDSLLGAFDLAANGTASFTFIPDAGTHYYYASYSSSVIPKSSSGVATVSVTRPSISEQAPDFNLTLAPGTSSTQVLPSGTSNTTFTFLVSPVGGTTVPEISIAANVMPPFVIATVTPQRISSGTAKASVMVLLNWGNSADIKKPVRLWQKLSPIALAFLLLPIGFARKRSRSKLANNIFAFLLMLVGAGLISGLVGCGSGIHNHATITATAGSISHSQTVSFMDEI